MRIKVKTSTNRCRAPRQPALDNMKAFTWTYLDLVSVHESPSILLENLENSDDLDDLTLTPSNCDT
jgi:hypothetical protein